MSWVRPTLVRSLAIALVAGTMVACSTQGSGQPGGATTFAPSVPSASPQVKAAVHAAAAAFYSAYFTHQFAAAWILLTPRARLQIPRKLWISVHERCLPAGAHDAGQIGALTVFGEAAIVTRHPGGGSQQSTTADVFNYAGGQWGYSPTEMSIYLHGSIGADTAAARKAGMCREVVIGVERLRRRDAGVVSVMGRSRVPRPAASSTAFTARPAVPRRARASGR